MNSDSFRCNDKDLELYPETVAQQLTETLESITDGFFAFDSDWRFIYVNATAESVLRIHRKDVLGQIFWEVFPAAKGTQIDKEYNLAAGGETRDFENHYKPLNRWFNVRCFPRKRGGISVYFQDITERKQLEEALRFSEERYRSVVEDQTDVITRFRPIEGTLSFVNEVFCRYLGKKREDIIGRKWQPIAIPEDVPMIEAELRLLSPSNPVVTIENRIYNATGAVRWMQFVNHGFFDDQGQLVEIQAVGRDITERKKIEEKYRSLIEITSDCIWEIDKHGSYTYLSPLFQNLTGYSPAEFLGKTPADLLPEDQDPQIREQMMAIRTAPQPFSAFDTQIRHRDGRLITMEVSGVPLFDLDGQFLGMRGITRDVTERKVIEDKLRNSEEQYRLLFDNAADAIVIVDMEAHILSANEQACRQYGYEKEQLLQLRVHDLDTPEEAVHIPERLALLARDGQAVFEAVHRDVKGNTFPVEAKAVKISFNGKPCLMSICRDITQRKEAEKFLKAMNDELERRVERRTRALQESQKQYLHAEKLTAIGRLSATIAHEFGNPLLGIQYFLKDLNNKEVLQGEDRHFLEIALEESQRIKDLIATLRDFSRTSPGLQAQMDVHKSLDSLLLLLKIDFNNKEILLVRDFAQELPEISAVPDQIKQVFLNLLTNAIDACPQAGAMIRVSTRQEGDNVAVAIEDNGCGIKPEQMERIFQPFYTTKPEVEGTGLGLSVSYGIVNKHGGEIVVHSTPGEGSTFTVILPIIGDQATLKNP